MFDPHRQDRHRRAAVGAKDSRPGPRLHGWGEHNPQQQLEQLHQLLGQAVQQPVIPHSPEAPGQHMLEQQPEELPAWHGLDHLLSLVGLDSKGNLPIFVRKDIFFWQDVTIQIAAKIGEGFFPLSSVPWSGVTQEEQPRCSRG